MYILHSRRKKTHVILTLAIVLLVLVAAGYIAKGMLRSDTQISAPPAAKITQVTDKRPPPKVIDMPQYSFQLPSDWERYTPAAGLLVGSSAWHNTAKDKGTQSLVIYIDSPVQELAVNRVLPVEVVNGDHFALAGTISDNCVNFTARTPEQTAKGKGRSKWQNVEFMCDTGNYVRQVAGIAAAGGINSAMLTGAFSGKHSVFMVFDDSTTNPNYEALSRAVQSFKLK